jgi:hypothetical protein
MFARSSGRVAAFLSASGAALSQEVADGKINVQSACALNMVYVVTAISSYMIRSFRVGLKR